MWEENTQFSGYRRRCMLSYWIVEIVNYDRENINCEVESSEQDISMQVGRRQCHTQKWKALETLI